MGRQRKVEQEMRRARVAELLAQGLSLSMIAKQVGVTSSTIAKDRDRILNRLKSETIQDVSKYRDLEMARLDTALENLWERVLSGDLQAVDRLLKIQDQRAKCIPDLQGPTKIEVTGDAISDEERAARIAAILDSARERRAKQSNESDD